MKTFTKLLLVLVAELALLAFLLNFSRASQLALTVFFPPLIAITLYFFVLIAFKVEHQHINKQDLIFATLLASVALFSTSIGYHFAANDLDVAFESAIRQAPVLSDFTINLQNQLYFLDETFSHWIMLAGAIGILIALTFWWYFNLYHKTKVVKQTEQVKSEQTILDLVITAFGGCFIGAIASFGMIEAQVSFLGVLAVAITLPILIYKWRSYKLSLDSFKGALLFVTLLATVLAINLAWLIVRKGGFLINF